MKIIRHETGASEEITELQDITIPDLWHIAMNIENKLAQKLVLDVWHLTHDLRGALLHIEAGANMKKPIHTK